MINISTSKHLDILTPSTNKALAQVLKNASPAELEIINNSKDLKSIMSSILKSSDASSSNKELLQLVKNNPTLKNLGDVSSTIKDLLNTIKSDKNPLPIETKLQNFLIDMKEIKNSDLKAKLENSGVFLESKLKDAKNPQLELKNTLFSLSKELQGSDTVSNRAIVSDIKELLNTPLLKNISQDSLTQNLKISTQLLEKLSTDITALLKSVNVTITKESMPLAKELAILEQKPNPLLDPKTTLLLNKLETLLTPKRLETQSQVKEIISNDLKAILLQATDEVTKVMSPNQSDLLKQIDKLSLQIDHHQLLSHLSNSSSLYLPFSWDMMQEGNIEIKHDDKERFYCDIDLKLKEYGEVNLKLSIYDNNQLNLHIYSQNDDFKELIKEALPELRAALTQADINPREIRVFEPQKTTTSPYDTQGENLYMGFEVKA